MVSRVVVLTSGSSWTPYFTGNIQVECIGPGARGTTAGGGGGGRGGGGGGGGHERDGGQWRRRRRQRIVQRRGRRLARDRLDRLDRGHLRPWRRARRGWLHQRRGPREFRLRLWLRRRVHRIDAGGGGPRPDR